MNRRSCVFFGSLPGLVAMQGCDSAMAPATVVAFEWREFDVVLVAFLIGAGWILVPRLRRRRKAMFRPLSEQRPGVLPA